MPLAKLYSRAAIGVEAPEVVVEVHLAGGLPAFHIVGMAETTVKESKDRVRSAIINSQLKFPTRRITVNLAPAALPKEGARFDLAIAIGILAASEQCPMDALDQYEWLGELALSGDLRPIDAALPAALQSLRAGRKLCLPQESASEAALVSQCEVLAAGNLQQVVAHLQNISPLSRAEPVTHAAIHTYPDLSEVKGQFAARRALEIAASGGHHLLFCGPPGTGKTLLASRLPGLLPPLEEDQMLETAAVYSAAGLTRDDLTQRPFRQPHHSASAVALVGGGSNPRPGEMSLAHNGVLFLDELAEFPRRILDGLRQPLENGHIDIARAKHRVTFPAACQLVAAMNPCPCGYDGDPDRECRCTPAQIQNYQGRVSGPLLDRIDIQLRVPRLPAGMLSTLPEGESSEEVRERVIKASATQIKRQGCPNAALNAQQLKQVTTLTKEAIQQLQQAEQQWQLSGRSHHKVLRIARTIADLERKEVLDAGVISEALALRTGLSE